VSNCFESPDRRPQRRNGLRSPDRSGTFGASSLRGDRLAFTAATKHGTAIHVTDFTGTQMRSVIHELGADVRVAGDSRDGTKLIYVRVAHP
jgi:hypothetical protein